jgi:hypothetical protein
MKDKPPLMRLVSVDLREYWAKEDTEFTPWLVEPNNLQFLGETIGMDLELVDTEANVGPYRADILCQDNNTGAYVLIENQLEQTDHLHLGQLMTYAAGLDTVNIIWIAQKFNDQHRAALDWLNRITFEDFHFFGIEVELWKIGDSAPAPKFNIVAKPNDWSKTIKSKHQASKSERTIMYRNLWSNLIEYIKQNFPAVQAPTPSGMNWIRFPMADDTHSVLSYAPSKKEMRVYLLFRGDNPEGWFQYVKSDSEKFQKEIGHSFEWITEKEGTGYGYKTFHFDHLIDDSYPEAFKMLGDLLQKLADAFVKRQSEFIEV